MGKKKISLFTAWRSRLSLSYYKWFLGPCVTPTATSCSSCPHHSTNCTILCECAPEAERYFTFNTTMVFLPGDHTLDTNITVANVARLTMRGEPTSSNIAAIVCDGPVGLSFTSMVELKILSLAFTSCGRKHAYAAMYIQSTSYGELVNRSFHENANACVVNNTTPTFQSSIQLCI